MLNSNGFFNSFLSVLRRSTQPAHLLIMSTVIALAMLFYPRNSSFVVLEIQPSADSTLWPLLYLSSFSILFGAQMWMTFVSGTLSFLSAIHYTCRRKCWAVYYTFVTTIDVGIFKNAGHNACYVTITFGVCKLIFAITTPICWVIHANFAANHLEPQGDSYSEQFWELLTPSPSSLIPSLLTLNVQPCKHVWLTHLPLEKLIINNLQVVVFHSSFQAICLCIV